MQKTSRISKVNLAKRTRFCHSFVWLAKKAGYSVHQVPSGRYKYTHMQSGKYHYDSLPY